MMVGLFFATLVERMWLTHKRIRQLNIALTNFGETDPLQFADATPNLFNVAGFDPSRSDGVFKAIDFSRFLPTQ
jgi:hypothetical protein